MLVLRNKMFSPTLQEAAQLKQGLMNTSKALQRASKPLASQPKKLPLIDKTTMMAKANAGGAKAQYQRAELPANWKPLRPVGRPAAPGMPQSSMAPRPVRF